MPNLALGRVRVVLVESAGPLNLGSIARVMKNMGLHQLVLVNPLCDPHCEEAQQMAVHAADVLQSAQIVSTLPAALAGCRRAIATTARDRALNIPLEHPRHGLPWLIDTNDGTTPTDAALIFGPEDRGLSNVELNYAQRCIRIPSSPVYATLNLAQAVAICCYELYQIAHGFDALRLEQTSDNQSDQSNCAPMHLDEAPCSNPPMDQTNNHADDRTESPPNQLDISASLDMLEGYYQHLERVLLDIGYLYPHTVIRRMEKFRRLFNRSHLSETEVAMLRGILRQVEWALQNPQSSITSPKELREKP